MFNPSVPSGADQWPTLTSMQCEQEKARGAKTNDALVRLLPIRQQRKSHFQLPEEQLKEDCLHKLLHSFMNESAVL